MTPLRLRPGRTSLRIPRLTEPSFEVVVSLRPHPPGDRAVLPTLTPTRAPLHRWQIRPGAQPFVSCARWVDETAESPRALRRRAFRDSLAGKLAPSDPLYKPASATGLQSCFPTATRPWSSEFKTPRLSRRRPRARLVPRPWFNVNRCADVPVRQGQLRLVVNIAFVPPSLHDTAPTDRFSTCGADARSASAPRLPSTPCPGLLITNATGPSPGNVDRVDRAGDRPNADLSSHALHPTPPQPSPTASRRSRAYRSRRRLAERRSHDSPHARRAAGQTHRSQPQHRPTAAHSDNGTASCTPHTRLDYSYRWMCADERRRRCRRQHLYAPPRHHRQGLHHPTACATLFRPGLARSYFHHYDVSTAPP